MGPRPAHAEAYPLFDPTLRSDTIPSPCPVMYGDKSDASLGLPEIFSSNASDSDSSTVPSDSDSSSESESESDDKSEDELALEDKEEQLLLKYYL